MEFYIPKTGRIVCEATGQKYSVVRGIHDIPDALADSKEAIDYGIKPLDEMTDAEWVSCGRQKPVTESKKGEVKTERTVAKESERV